MLEVGRRTKEVQCHEKSISANGGFSTDTQPKFAKVLFSYRRTQAHLTPVKFSCIKS